VQLRVLHELVYSARRMGNADIAIRYRTVRIIAVLSLVAWRAVALCRINEVALCWARLVLGWVTVYGQVNHLGTKPTS